MDKINWFEIPSNDFARACQFYESLFAIKLVEEKYGNGQMALFWPEGGTPCGAVVHMPILKAGSDGVVIYLNAEPSIDQVLERARRLEAIIVQDKLQLPDGNGYIALLIDSEGNRVGLHSLN